MTNTKNNKTPQRSSGDRGENIACKYLESKGYTIMCRNFKCYYGEIDIIAQNDKCTAFVEVKTRRKSTSIRPCLSVTKSKQIKIIRTAYIYLQGNKINKPPRFDVAEVYLENNCDSFYKINYIKGAFVQEGDV